jgi:hypothetical protein
MSMREPRFEAVFRAANIVGSPETLRALLGVPMADLADWLAKRGTPSIDAFLRAVDIIEAAGAVDNIQRASRLRRKAQSS